MTAGTLTAEESRPGDLRIIWADAIRLGAIAGQLALAILVIRMFQLESRTFYHIALLALLGFVVNAVLPTRYRLPWFAAISLGGILLAVGVSAGFLLIGAGLGLIAICHLPIAFGWRVFLLLATAGVLAAMRSGWMASPWPIAIWPILGSMFMFRLFMYMHALRTSEARPTAAQSLSYFFMLPNVVFPLFPLVDYPVFQGSYYQTDRFRIYQRGVQWIARGMLHLILYRVVYYYGTLDPAEVSDLPRLLQYFASAFLLYLRVSGQFHIAIGMLHLFGFYLPETHHLYYLSSSFTDFWRRINIYWKDFMMKYVYLPSFLRLRRHGTVLAVVVSVGAVFLVTLVLHSYQWFWLLGNFPVTAPDVMFWLVISTFLLFHVLKETRQGRSRVLIKQKRWSWTRGLSAVGMFLVISALWGLWESPTLGEFFSLFEVADRVTVPQVLVLAGIALGYAIFAGFPWGVRTLTEQQGRAILPFWQRPAAQTTALLGGLLAVGSPAFLRVLPGEHRLVVQSLQEDRLSEKDAAAMQRGYYEQLIGVESYSSQKWDTYRGTPQGWARITESPIFRPLPTLMGGELVASGQIRFKGAELSTNEWGMRDRLYSLSKPPGTVRAALLGPSTSMGTGVADGETFEQLVEDRINGGVAAGSFEFLNFSVAAHSLIQQVLVLEERVWRFDPDMVLLVYHPYSDRRIAYQNLAKAVRRGAPVEDSVLLGIIHRSGVRPDDSEASAFRKLYPFGQEIVEWAFERVASAARAHHVPAVLLVIDLPKERSNPRDRLMAAARVIGFDIWDFRDAYGTRNPDDLLVAPWDKHPNAEGHQLLADRLHDRIQARLREIQSIPSSTSGK